MKRKSTYIYIGTAILVLFLVCAVFAPLISPYNPDEQNLEERLKPPGIHHIFGQDHMGRDIFSRVIYGSRISILVGLVTVSVSAFVGLVIGAAAGFSGGVVDEILMRVTDVFLAFPGILLAIAMMAVLGPSLKNVIVALCILGWVGYARMVRGQVMGVVNLEYVASARALGAGRLRIIIRHIIPNIMGPVIVQSTFGVAGAIISEAGLSFLGLGTQPPTPSWGAMLNEGREVLLVAPHLSIFPGIGIMLIVLALNFVGDSLRDMLDPKDGQ